RHGTTTLFAALNVLDGAVIAQCKPRHRHQEFLAFLRHIEANVPAQLDVHLVVDNYATHKHPKVRAWLARRPRWHIHFTPTYASWLNQVERFFALITQRAIRRGSFESTADLVKKIDRFIRTYNANSQPFVWTATADAILQKLARLCQRISGTEPLECKRGNAAFRGLDWPKYLNDNFAVNVEMFVLLGITTNARTALRALRAANRKSLRRRGRSPSRRGQPVRHEVVTHVLGTFCYP